MSTARHNVWLATAEIQFIQRLRSKLETMLDGEDEDHLSIVRDTIEGETDVEGIVTKLIHAINETDAIIEGRKAYIAKLQSANKAGDNFIERTRALLRDCLDAAGQDSVKTVVGTASIVPGSLQVSVEHESQLPPIYIKTSVDQAAVRKAALELEKVRAPILANVAITEAERKKLLSNCPAIPGVKVERGEPTLKITPPRAAKADTAEAPAKATKSKSAKAA